MPRSRPGIPPSSPSPIPTSHPESHPEPRPRDTARSAVYAAEDQVMAVLDRGGNVDFFGSTLTIAAQRRFADVASIQRYVDGVLALPAIHALWPAAGPVRVRERAGARTAHYERRGAVLAIPLAGPAPRWAARELVVLHELAHHLSPPGRGRAAHGPAFTGTLVSITECVLGAEVALLLRAAYDGAGVGVDVIGARESHGGSAHQEEA